MSAPDPMGPDLLALTLGRLPTEGERAVAADQARRLDAIWHHPLLPGGEGLAALPPFSEDEAP